MCMSLSSILNPFFAITLPSSGLYIPGAAVSMNRHEKARRRYWKNVW
jgi:hypothetical protein